MKLSIGDTEVDGQPGESLPENNMAFNSGWNGAVTDVRISTIENVCYVFVYYNIFSSLKITAENLAPTFFSHVYCF